MKGHETKPDVGKGMTATQHWERYTDNETSKLTDIGTMHPADAAQQRRVSIRRKIGQNGFTKKQNVIVDRCATHFARCRCGRLG